MKRRCDFGSKERRAAGFFGWAEHVRWTTALFQFLSFE